MGERLDLRCGLIPCVSDLPSRRHCDLRGISGLKKVYTEGRVPCLYLNVDFDLSRNLLRTNVNKRNGKRIICKSLG